MRPAHAARTRDPMRPAHATRCDPHTTLAHRTKSHQRVPLAPQGTVVLCDWSLYPGSDGSDAPTESEAFMSYLSTSGAGATARHSLRDKEVFTVSKWEGPFI